MPTSGHGPLTGMRVVEVATYVAAPSAGLTLAQLGADVIRIDPLHGAADTTRSPTVPATGRSLYWAGLNRPKRSVAVDFDRPEGRELVAALVTAPGERAGLYVTNDAGRPWLRDEALRPRRPDLVHVQVVGRPDGSPAVDYTVNAASGFAEVTGSAAGGPTNQVLPAWDLMAGLLVAVGLLAAEGRRRTTGQGEHIRLALSDVALATAASLGYFADVQVNDQDRGRDGNFVFGMFGCDFETADARRVMVVTLTDRHWAELCDVTGRGPALDRLASQLGADLARRADRVAHRAAVADVLRPWFAVRTLAEIGEELAGRRVLWAPYRTFRQVLAEDPACRDDTSVLRSVDEPDAGRYLAARTPLRFAGWAPPEPVPAPRVGAHTEEVLAEVLGLSPAEVGRLRALGVITT